MHIYFTFNCIELEVNGSISTCDIIINGKDGMKVNELYKP